MGHTNTMSDTFPNSKPTSYTKNQQSVSEYKYSHPLQCILHYGHNTSIEMTDDRRANPATTPANQTATTKTGRKRAAAASTGRSTMNEPPAMVVTQGTTLGKRKEMSLKPEEAVSSKQDREDDDEFQTKRSAGKKARVHVPSESSIEGEHQARTKKANPKPRSIVLIV